MRSSRYITKRILLKSRIRSGTPFAPVFSATDRSRNHHLSPLTTTTTTTTTTITTTIIQQNYFSTKPTTTTTHRNDLREYEIEAMEHGAIHMDAERENAARLLNRRDYPVGSYTPETWFEAQAILQFWTAQRSIESVHWTFRLLYRFLQEKQQQSSHHQFDTTANWPDSQTLNDILNNWRVVWWNHEMPEYTPFIVWNYMEKYNQWNLPPTEKLFYFLMDAHVRRRPDDAEESSVFCQKLLHRCLTLWNQGNEACRPTNDLFNMVLLSLTRSSASLSSSSSQQQQQTATTTISIQTAQQAEALLDQMLQFQIKVTRRTYNRVMHAWALTGTEQGAIRAQELLQRMYNEYRAGDVRVMPSTNVFCTVLSAWAKAGVPQASERATNILQEMQRLHQQNELYNKRDVQTVLNAAVCCHANSKTRQGAQRAQDLFDYMQQQQRSRRKRQQRPDVITYSSLISAWMHVGNGDMAEAILRDLLTQWKNGRSSSIKPTNQMFVQVMAAWAKSKAPDKLQRAQAVMDTLEQCQDDELYLTTAHFNVLLDCVTRTKQGHTGSQAEAIFERMQTMHAQGVPEVQPDELSYDNVIRAWAGTGHAVKADEWFRRRIADFQSGNQSAKPSLTTFNIVLSAFIHSKYKDAAEKAELFLKQFQDMYDMGELDFEPDVYSYSSVLACLSKTKNQKPAHENAKKAENLLRQMQARFHTGVEAVRPNKVAYNAVINAYSRAKNPRRAAAILEEMYKDYVNGNKEAAPDDTSFNTLIKAWAFSMLPEAPERVEEILHRMNELHRAGIHNVKPTVVSYTTAILAYGLSERPGAPQRAEEVLRHMDSLYKAGELDEGPNRITYRTLRKAWSTSNEPDKLERAAAIQKEMEERFGPDEHARKRDRKKRRDSTTPSNNNS